MAVKENREFGTSRETDPQATRIWLMRHGPTQWNLERRLQGNVDTELVAEALFPYFERIGASELPQPDRLVVTGFQRSRKTAEGLIEYRNWPPDIPIIKVPALGERKWGRFERMTHAEVLAELMKEQAILSAYPNIAEMSDLSPVIDAPGFKVEGAESIDEVSARAVPAVFSFLEQFPGETVGGIVHAGVLISLGLDHHIINHIEIRQENGVPIMVKIPLQ